MAARLRKKMEHTTKKVELVDPAVAFTSKELFLEVNRKIDDVLKVLNQKADRAEHDRVEQQVEAILRDGTPQSRKVELEVKEIEGQVRILHDQSATSAAVNETKQRIEDNAHDTKMQWLAIFFSFILGLATLAVSIASLYHK